jgi:hypothetical protein
VTLAADIASVARDLKTRHGDLLNGQPSFTPTTEQRQAIDALEAAQARLRGGERDRPDQLVLDVRPR